MLSLGSTVIGVQDVARATRFWCEALDFAPTSPGDETWIILQAKDGSRKRISLALSETPVQEHPRIHLDLYAPGDKMIEVERLKALGAREVDWDLYPDAPDFYVLADTEGNRFCVIDGVEKAAG